MAEAGSRGDWLPAATWVMSSWLPYDEARLQAILGVDREDLDAWLDDRRSLGQLAALHGYRDLPAFAARLVAPRATDHGATSMARLRARALDTLTQPHLARHVLFHVYHSSRLARDARRVFGVSPARYRRLRDRGWTPVRIAYAGGVSPTALRGHLHTFFARRARLGRQAGAMSARQAARLLAIQDEGLPAYIERHYRTRAEQACYADQGSHDRGHDGRDCPMAM